MTAHGTPQGERTGAGNGGGLAGAVRTGWVIFLALALLTLVEYIIAVSLEANLPIIIGLAVVTAGLIAWYFMPNVRDRRGWGGEAWGGGRGAARVCGCAARAPRRWRPGGAGGVCRPACRRAGRW